ncbi:MAG: hypothetical protein FWC41_06335 [Firmicutes bacterium]|nr:hypothetical protein [Bacillota bacterium]
MGLKSFFSELASKAKNCINIRTLPKDYDETINKVLEEVINENLLYENREKLILHITDCIIKELENKNETLDGFNKKDYEYAIVRCAKKNIINKEIKTFYTEFKKDVIFAYISDVKLVVYSRILDKEDEIKGSDLGDFLSNNVKAESEDVVLLTITLLFEKKIISKKNYVILLANYIIKTKEIKYLRNAIKLSKYSKCFKMVSEVYLKQEINPLVDLIKKAYDKRRNEVICDPILNHVIKHLCGNVGYDNISYDAISKERKEKYFLLIPKKTKKIIMKYIDGIVKSTDIANSNFIKNKFTKKIVKISGALEEIFKIPKDYSFSDFSRKTSKLVSVGNDIDNDEDDIKNLREKLNKNRFNEILEFYKLHVVNQSKSVIIPECEDYVKIFKILSKTKKFKKENLEELNELFTKLIETKGIEKFELHKFVIFINDHLHQLENIKIIERKLEKKGKESDKNIENLKKTFNQLVTDNNINVDNFEVILRESKDIFLYKKNIMDLYKILRKNSFDDYELKNFYSHMKFVHHLINGINASSKTSYLMGENENEESLEAQKEENEESLEGQEEENEFLNDNGKLFEEEEISLNDIKNVENIHKKSEIFKYLVKYLLNHPVIKQIKDQNEQNE